MVIKMSLLSFSRGTAGYRGLAWSNTTGETSRAGIDNIAVISYGGRSR